MGAAAFVRAPDEVAIHFENFIGACDGIGSAGGKNELSLN